jgi:hypothetical protein
MEENNVDHNKNWLIGGLLIVIGVLAIAFMMSVFADDPQAPDGGDNGSPSESTPEEDELEAILGFIDEVRPYLSTEAQEDLDMIEEYIQDNPDVLEKEFDEHPQDIQEAFKRVQMEYEEKLGSGEIENPDSVIQIGDVFTIVGTLELVDNDSPVGNIYFVEDSDTGAELYFVFPQETIDEINEEEMIGEEVTIELEITDVIDSDVSFIVLSGPALVE